MQISFKYVNNHSLTTVVSLKVSSSLFLVISIWEFTCREIRKGIKVNIISNKSKILMLDLHAAAEAGTTAAVEVIKELMKCNTVNVNTKNMV